MDKLKDLVGRRIEFAATTDPYSQMRPGLRGTIVAVDAVGTLHVEWDDGSQLGMVPGEDEFIILPEAN